MFKIGDKVWYNKHLTTFTTSKAPIYMVREIIIDIETPEIFIKVSHCESLFNTFNTHFPADEFQLVTPAKRKRFFK